MYPARVPTPFDHALAFALAVLFPIRAATGTFRRLKLAPPGTLPAARRRAYREAMLLQWGLVALLAALWAWLGRPWTALGLVPGLTPGFLGVAAGAALMAVLVWRQRTGILADDGALDAVRAKLAGLEVMLPHTREELRRFYALSVTAGVCEELLYRAFLIWYLAQFTGLVQAVALSSVVFGVGHAYQGWKGVLKTGAFGLFLGAVYVVSGSILLPALLHALMDAHSGHLVQRALERAARARARLAFGAVADDPVEAADSAAEAAGVPHGAAGAEAAAADDPPAAGDGPTRAPDLP